ncbi:hypothetical protein GCM10028803_40630 [Larkinella knui]|uniref:MFS transporter n=1 Tax=Larkinella knui TaxID=2025310 RepID=A0A3P1CFA4_9BACT|nr:hypothetical protein [Larkinella knui]RRB11900.1 hypothetical protein EHT87_25900 [Larkinella knui]
MCIAFIPFTTAFYSEYSYWSVPMMWYSANIALTGLLQWWMWKYATRQNRLIDPSTNPHLVEQISLGHLGVPIGFSLAFLGGFLGYPFALAFTWMVIPLIIRLARRRYERRMAGSH